MNGFTSRTGDAGNLSADDLMRCSEALARKGLPRGPIALGLHSQAIQVLKSKFPPPDALLSGLLGEVGGVELIHDNRLSPSQSIPIYTRAALKRYVEEIEAGAVLTVEGAA